MILTSIDFPNLNPAALTIPLQFDSPFGHIGPLVLRWYALAYIAGLVLGWRWIVRLIRNEKLWGGRKPGITAGQADDYLMWATLGVILGGRLGYVLFYMIMAGGNEAAKFWQNPLVAFRIWEGGMSFHGGLIGVALVTLWFASKARFDPLLYQDNIKAKAVKSVAEKDRDNYIEVSKLGWIKKSDDERARKDATLPVKLLDLGDVVAAATPLGLFFGRVANFINGELYGRESSLPWAMRFPAGGYDWKEHKWLRSGFETARHPSQLYEACLEGVALFAIINIATFRFKSLQRPGLNVGLFLVCYGLFRALMENVREPDQQMPDFLRGHITMGMLLSLPMIAIGAWLIRRAFKIKQPAAA